MTNTEALQALADKVEAGEFWGDMPRPQCLHTDLCWKAFNGSLDAAKALMEAVLPGWFWWRDQVGRFWVSNYTDAFYAADKHTNPARAWLLAILRALIAGGRE